MRRRSASGSRPREFILLTTGRAGSGLLIGLLDNHPDVFVPPWPAAEILKDGSDDPAAEVARWRTKAEGAGASHWGWSVHPPHFARSHVSAVPFIEGAHARGARIITLTRRNPVARALSGMVMYWNRLSPHITETESKGSTRLDLHETLRNVNRCLEENCQITQWVGTLSHAALTYEDDLVAPDAQQRTVQRLTTYLGLSEGIAALPQTRKRRIPLRDQIPNWEDIAEMLAVAGFGTWLEELEAAERGAATARVVSTEDTQ